MNNHTYKRSVFATLYRIATASPFAERLATYASEKEMLIASRRLSLEWQKEEQALLWAIYTKAVYDHLGIAMRMKRRGYLPNETARTGVITLYTGRKANILELLGINPDWAWEQIETTVNYAKMKEAA